MPEQHEIGFLPETMRAKHIDILLDLRTNLEQKMLDHVDKYNGFCSEKEEMLPLKLVGDRYFKVVLRYKGPMIDSPLAALCRCSIGQTYNR